MDVATDTEPSLLALDGAMVDLAARQVVHNDGTQFGLTALETQLLSYLARQTRPVPSTQLLTEVWGYSPRSSSRAPYVTIQRLRKKIEVNPSEPRNLRSTYGQGYRLVMSTPSPSQIEVGLLGRRRECRTLRQLLRRERLTTLLGPPGVGKTRLARHVVHQLRAHGTRVECVDLGHDKPGSESVQHIAAAYGFPDDLPAAMHRHGEHLLVLDGVEHLSPWLSAALPGWLDAAPRMRLLVTTRRRLHRVRGQTVHVGPLEPASATEVMLQMARSTSQFEATKAQHRQLTAIAAETLGGIPLALEFAGARLGVLSAAELTDRLAQPFDVLSGPSHDRWLSLQDALLWSWNLLTDREQRSLRVCAKLPDAFGLRAVEGLMGERSPWVMDAMQSLTDHCLLQPSEGPEPRFRMLKLMKTFVTQRA